MSDLVERYVHQVGRYLPGSEREEVQNELRSLLQDQLDDRYKGAPSEDDVVELLAEFGEPRQMAASYSGEQYLVGPDLYPTMMLVLQRGWIWIPILVVLIRVLIAFLTAEPTTLIGLFLDTAFAVAQALLVFSAIVVLIFAIMQHSGVDLDEKQEQFNPRDLPRVDDRAAIDRGEVVFGIAFNIFGIFILSYFLRVGGLTLRFNPAETVAVLPVPQVWLIIYIAALAFETLVDVMALRRGRWSIGLLLGGMVMKLLGVLGAYHVLMVPLFGLLFETVPGLTNIPFAQSAPQIFAAFIAFMTVVDSLTKIIKIIFGGAEQRPFVSVDPKA
jgi:hypothetical protein